ncbi:response regulator transcription factor [Nitrosomonas sp. Nm51]|uniref:response regulator transcription factor n=1 Tax=Nitrosomonas sp. Nm51 TaxID=133720 RepID=UPI000B84A038|nr:response regulator transcription factor [Nitrosomonas sp. Nm51]
MSGPKTQIMLVDDHAMMRHGITLLVNMEPDMEVCAEAGDGTEALTLLKKNGRVDIVLLDITLKTVPGFEVIKSMHLLLPALPVLFVSMHDEDAYAERALQVGGRGYVSKQEPGAVLITAIREVLKGNIYLSKKMHAKLLRKISAGYSEPEQLINTLTLSEFEVFHLIGTGHSSQEIARLLNRSVKTIETHRFNIRTKLNLKDGADLIRYATQWNLDELRKSMS